MSNVIQMPVTILDDFSSAIDIGDELFSDTNHPMKVDEISWDAPDTVGDEATVKDGGDDVIFYKMCATQYQGASSMSIGWVRGITIDANGVGSGKITIRFA